MPPHDAEVQFSRGDTLLDNTRVGNLQPEFDTRMATSEVRDDPGHHIDPWRRACADHQRAVAQAVEIFQSLLRAVHGEGDARRIAL